MGLEVLHHAVDLLGGHQGAVDPGHPRGSGWNKEHVSLPQELLSAHLVQNGARVHLLGDTKGNAGGEIGLDDSREHVHRRALGGHDQVDPHRPGHLGQAHDGIFHVL